MSNYIIHWGIPGMKWGVRRYRNKDGTLTAAGQRRYDRDKRDNDSKKKENKINLDNRDANANRWVKEDLTRSRNLVRESSNLVGDIDKFEKATRGLGNKKTKRMDLSSMSDKQMRDKINRELLERQYNQVFNDDANAHRGREIVNNTLAVVGATLGIASSSLGIALAIKELKG